jgi:uncharacterized protein (DUF2252 family)
MSEPLFASRSVSDRAPSRSDRIAAGRAARRIVPMTDLGRWDRKHDALSTVFAQNADRLSELVPLRMSRMAASPWTYYRGAAAVMAADLDSTPHSGLAVQLCGDAHVLNFGLWATPERQLSFDLRDFDETLRGPFEWDVKRFVASLVVLARDNAVPERQAIKAVRSGLRAYREKIADCAAAHELTVWYDLVTSQDLLGLFEPEEQERVARRLEKRAARRTSRGAARKLTRVVDGRPRIVADPPVRVRLEDAAEAENPRELAADVMQAYHDSLPYERRHLLDRFSMVDVVRQVVGVGSVGMRIYLVLLEGRNGDDPLFLQIKQAVPSVYEEYLGASPYNCNGQRVINGKRLIQAASDIFLGWTKVHGLDFYVRQFRDMKVIPNGDIIAPRLTEFAAQCGAVLGRAHARTGDALAISGYIGKGRRFDKAMTSFAVRYADQTDVDHRQFAAAVADSAG